MQKLHTWEPCVCHEKINTEHRALKWVFQIYSKFKFHKIIILYFGCTLNALYSTENSEYKYTLSLKTGLFYSENTNIFSRNVQYVSSALKRVSGFVNIFRCTRICFQIKFLNRLLYSIWMIRRKIIQCTISRSLLNIAFFKSASKSNWRIKLSYSWFKNVFNMYSYPIFFLKIRDTEYFLQIRN